MAAALLGEWDELLASDPELAAYGAVLLAEKVDASLVRRMTVADWRAVLPAGVAPYGHVLRMHQLAERSQPLVPSPPPSPPEHKTSTAHVSVETASSTFTAVLASLFFSVPSAEHIKTYLDTLMLLTTLMFGFGASLLYSFDAEHLEDADKRWYGWCTNGTIRALPRIDDWCTGVEVSAATDVDTDPNEVLNSAWERPSVVFGQRAMATYGLLAASLTVAMTQYTLFLAFRLDTASDAVRDRWWRFFQWPCHVSFALFILGSFYFVYCNAAVTRLVFTADVPMLLAGAPDGLWHQVQVAMGTVAVGWVVVICADAGLLGVWRWLDVRRVVA